MDDNVSIVANGTNDLICAICFSDGEKVAAIGICKQCKYYLCGKCTIAHQQHCKHRMAYFYCAQKLRANRYVRANSFCLDCGQYLCNKCVVDHGGYWQYRHHSLIGRRSQTLSEIPLDYRQTPPDKAKRRPTTKSTERSMEKQGRASPYAASETLTPLEKLPRHEKMPRPRTSEKPPRSEKSQRSERSQRSEKLPRQHRQAVNIKETIKKPRTLLQSNVGRLPQTDDQRKLEIKESEHSKRPKSVHYEDDHHSASLVGEYPISAPNDTKPCKIVASVYLGDESLAMADSANRNIKLYDKNCNCVSTLEMEKLPLAICASERNLSRMFVSSGDQIHTLGTEEGLHVVQSFDTGIPRIEGITLWTSGIAAIFKSVRSQQDKKGHWEVHLFSYEGQVKFEIAISTPLAVKLVTPIWYISSSKDGNDIYISDTHNNRILCIDIINWHVVYVIKGRDAGGAPSSIATDTEGNVLVAWYNEIHNISQSGKDLGVAVPNIGKGSVIAFNPATNKLAVWSDKKSHTNKISLYQMN